MSDLLLTVVIPVYNCEGYLAQCVESVMQQTVQSLEIILVDDGSQDGSPVICDMYASKDQRVRVVHKANQGAAAARKTGIELAIGRYIMFLDSDDWLDADYAEMLLACTEQKDPDVVVGLMRGFDEDGKITEYHHYFSSGYYDKDQLKKTIFPQMLSAKPYYTFGIAPAMWGKLFKSEIAKNNLESLDTGIIFGEDGCFTYSVLLDAESVYITDACGYNYRTNMASATHCFTEKLWDDGSKLRDFLAGLVQKKNWEVETQIQEYMALVCNYTVTKAIKAGYVKRKQGREELKEYIQDILPRDIFKNEKFRKSGFKMKLKFRLMKCNALRILAAIMNARN